MSVPERYADIVTTYSKTTVLVLLVATLVVGSAAGNVDGGLSLAEFGSNSEEAQKLEYVTANFSTEGENTTAVQVIVRGDDVLSKESLLASLRLQRSIRDDERIAPTLRENQSTVGLANLVALRAIQRERMAQRQAAGRPAGGNASGPPPNASAAQSGATPANASGSAGPPGSGSGRPLPGLDEQIEQLASMSASEVQSTLDRVLDPEATAGSGPDPYAFLPTDYDGSSGTDARMFLVFQTAPERGELPAAIGQAQLAISDLVDSELPGDRSFAFGQGIVEERSTQAAGDSFALITPVAFLLVVGVLLFAYRDLLDVALGLLGIVLVLVWMGGFMGWTGIGVTQILIAVPFLLIGLSIDYALHVVMRYREANEEHDDRSPEDAMRVGLGGVTVALGATTFTTAVGFFSNTVSPIGSIQEFGLVSGVGILAAFVVFAGILPALKVELEGLLEWVGFAREKRAFGTGGAVRRVLGVGSGLARRVPIAVLVVGLLVSSAGGVAATDIDTSLNQVDFLPRDSPEWMDSVPAAVRPGDYHLRDQATYLNDRFLQSNDRSRVEILVEGPVTDPRTLDRIAAGRDRIAGPGISSAITLASGEPRTEDPVSLIRSLSETDESVGTVVEEADTDGDGIPDRNLEAVYDAVYAAAPDRAASVIYREDGEYRALRMGVSVQGSADTGTITEEMRSVAATIAGETDLEVTATGQPVVNEVVQQGLLRTLVETFLITLGVILAFLTAIFYRRYGTLTLGAVTLVPVVFALSWILGTMYLLGIPFNTETAIIASIAIGLGVDYAIHVSERFVEELERTGDAGEALDRTVAGTGGALLASAATTTCGFGVLMLALVPSLRRFGLVTGTTIVFAFLASVVVLPSALVLWAGRSPSMDVASTPGSPAPDPDAD